MFSWIPYSHLCFYLLTLSAAGSVLSDTVPELGVTELGAHFPVQLSQSCLSDDSTPVPQGESLLCFLTWEIVFLFLSFLS